MTGLPPTLERFGAELEDAARRDLGSRRRRRRTIRGAAVLAVVAAAALGLSSALTTRGPSAVERAAAALQSSDDTILHFQMDAVQQNGDGTTASWHSETWQLLVAPYTRRQIQLGSDGIRAESVTEGDTNELYDAGNDTIYVATSQELRDANMPEIKIVSQSELARVAGPNVSAGVHASVLYYVGKDKAKPQIIATKQGAERFRKALARQRRQENTGQAPEDFRDDIVKLLNSGTVRVTGHQNVDGRDAIRIESLDGKQVYLVDAATYAPIEWTTTGDSGGVTLRFPLYEELPVDNPSKDLLSLEAQHPGAKVERGATGYVAAEKRLYPHG
jgi:outer membrane lipoprotein-sorting protein